MKLRGFSFIFISKIALIVALFCLASCKSDEDTVNKTFNQKYGKEVERVRLDRLPPQAQFPQEKLEFTAPIERDFRYANNNLGADLEQYSNFEGALSQVFLQDADARNQAPSQMGSIFDNPYRAPINVPFRKIGDEFDAIEVPEQDAYGVKTGMLEKEYLLVSKKLLQKNVDQINNSRSENDLEDSEALIAEQKQIKRKLKMIKIFGEEALELEDEEKAKSLKKAAEAKAAKEKAKKNSDAVAAKSAAATSAVKTPIATPPTVMAPPQAGTLLKTNP